MPKIIPINVALISNPFNWLIILLMLIIASYILEVFFIANPNCGCAAKSK